MEIIKKYGRTCGTCGRELIYIGEQLDMFDKNVVHKFDCCPLGMGRIAYRQSIDENLRIFAIKPTNFNQGHSPRSPLLLDK